MLLATSATAFELVNEGGRLALKSISGVGPITLEIQEWTGTEIDMVIPDRSELNTVGSIVETEPVESGLLGPLHDPALVVKIPALAEEELRSILVDAEFDVKVSWNPQGSVSRISGFVYNESNDDGERPITISLVIPVPDKQVTWLRDQHRELPVEGQPELMELVGTTAGARGAMSRFPFAAVTTSNYGLGLGLPMDRPRIHRVRWDGQRNALVAEIDVTISGETVNFPDMVPFEFIIFEFEPERRFRGALREWYDANPVSWEHRVKKQGQWMPFTQLDTVQRVEDFAFQFHEYHPNVSVAYNNANGIESLVYCEPVVQYVDMAPDTPRTLEALSEIIMSMDSRKGSHVRSSSTRGRDDQMQVTWVETPWAVGARVPTNSNPDLPRTDGDPYNGFDGNWLAYQELYDQHPPNDPESVTGLYLDSFEGWDAKDLNYRREHLRLSRIPLTFDATTARAAQVIMMHNFELAEEALARLRKNGHLLMANTALYQWAWSVHFLDVLGIETSWGEGETIAPPRIDEMDYLRAMLYHKPYCYLQNVRFANFRGKKVEDYFARCFHYGFWPGFFSHNAAEAPYWQDPDLYNEDRPVFLRYMQPQQRTTTAGWEPITFARSGNENILIERWGGGSSSAKTDLTTPVYFTLYNPSEVLQSGEFSLEPELLSTSGFLAIDLLEGTSRRIEKNNVPWRLEPLSVDCVMLVERSEEALESVIELQNQTIDELAEKYLRFEMIDNPLREEWSMVSTAEDWLTIQVWSEKIYSALEPLYQPEFLRAISILRALQAGKEGLPGSGGSLVQMPVGIVPGETVLFRSENGAKDLEVRLSCGTETLKPYAMAPEASIPIPLSWSGENSIRVEVRSPDGKDAGPWFLTDLPTLNAISIDPQPREIILGERSVLNLELRNNLSSVMHGSLELELPEGITTSPLNSFTLPAQAGRSLKIELEVTDRPLERDLLDEIVIDFESDDRTSTRVAVPIIVLAKNASLLRAEDVLVRADSTYYGYNLSPLNDGIVEDSSLTWNEVAWASDEGVTPHWVEFTFSSPTSLSEVILYWAKDNEAWQTSQMVHVQIREADDTRWRTVGTSENEKSIPSSRLEFDEVEAMSLRIFQPAGKGVIGRPGLLWLSEVEAK